MLDAKNLLELIKQAALEAWEASQPCDCCFGKVISADPLKISVEQKMVLDRQHLVLTRNVTDYKMKITGGNIADFFYSEELPDGETNPVEPTHVHAIGTIDMLVHNALKVGEKVVLIRKKGGQKYLVVDRVME